MQKKIALIACVSQKGEMKSQAKDLYISQLFKSSLVYAQKLNLDKIFILSALHHLLELHTEIEPYNVTLSSVPKNKRKAGLKILTSAEKKEWGKKVIEQLSKVTDLKNDEFIFLAGQQYIKPLINSFSNYKNPLQGLKQGQRLKYLKGEFTMGSIALELHQMLNEQKRFSFPFEEHLSDIPKNGIYFIFENGEKYNSLDRIVRVGTHTGNNQLHSRLNQHFVKENKNRSIFRKNIGRCLLNKEGSSYLPLWELDTTSRVDKEKNLQLLNKEFEKDVEHKITEYVQSNLTFCVLQIDDKQERLSWERKIVSTLAKGGDIKPSENWLGNYSPKEKIKKTGLWQVNELNKAILNDEELEELKDKFSGEVILFEFGTEGGGATVSQLSNKSVVEKGSSGGIMDEDEDPHRNWENKFASWEAWWQNFTDQHKDFWIRFYPLFIHHSIKPFVRNAVKNYNYPVGDLSHQLDNWRRKLK